MLYIKRITMKNFFSFGNAPQVLDLDSNALTLVLGQNNDVTVENDYSSRRNGVGKSAIIQGLVYGLYGKSINNEIKIPNLINKINTKNCEVQIEFNKDGIDYKVERGRSPTFFNFIKLNEDGTEDNSRGEKKDTQEDLNEVLGISQLLFEHIVVLNANVEPFLAQSSQKQRDLIEELFGITQLTEKAMLLKDMHKDTKNKAEQEKFKIETIESSNKRIQESIKQLEQSAENFEVQKTNKINQITENINMFDGIDFDALLLEAKEIEEAKEHNRKLSELENTVQRLSTKFEQYENTLKQNKENINKQILQLEELDISTELSKHDEIEVITELEKLQREQLSTVKLKEQELTGIKFRKTSTEKEIKSEKEKLISKKEHKCPLCHSELEHTEDHAKEIEVLESKIKELEEQFSTLEHKETEITEYLNSVEHITVPSKPQTFYKSKSEATLHEHKLKELKEQYSKEDINIYQEELINELTKLENTSPKEVKEGYSTEEVKDLKRTYEVLLNDLEREINSVNPYHDQIKTITANSIQKVDYSTFNELHKLAEHQDYLVKLLLNKDSYVRRRILDQNITYLNARLQHWVERMGSQQVVEFMNDLSVDINLNGQSYDFKQLSRGERTRITIALDLAFRDTYESLYQSINIMLLDEILDVGLDSDGVSSAWDILQENSSLGNKNIFVVSHKDELMNRANDILLITKEDSFSTIEYTTIMDM